MKPAARTLTSKESGTLRGRVIAAHGRQYQVECEDGSLHRCFPRGKKSLLACGDWVNITLIAPSQGVIESLEPRRNLFYRSNERHQKLIAANLDQVVIVCATEPAFSDDLINRCLLAAHDQHVQPLVVLNKVDLPARLDDARTRLSPLFRLGYPILELSALTETAALKTCLSGKTSLLVGQSGMGKSTLINALIPGTHAPTREISSALDSGKHTTTHATLYHLDSDSHLIDSPGLQEFGLRHLDQTALEQGFPEFGPLLGHCRFRDCHHDREPGCALQTALTAGDIFPTRFATFRKILAALHAS